MSCWLSPLPVGIRPGAAQNRCKMSKRRKMTKRLSLKELNMAMQAKALRELEKEKQSCFHPVFLHLADVDRALTSCRNRTGPGASLRGAGRLEARRATPPLQRWMSSRSLVTLEGRPDDGGISHSGGPKGTVGLGSTCGESGQMRVLSSDVTNEARGRPGGPAPGWRPPRVPRGTYEAGKRIETSREKQFQRDT